MHEHRHEQAPGAVVDPHHEHPVGRQLRCTREEVQGNEEGQGDRSGVSSTYPGGGHKEVPRAPQDAHDEPGRQDAVMQPQPGDGEPRPAELLDEAPTSPTAIPVSTRVALSPVVTMPGR